MLLYNLPLEIIHMIYQYLNFKNKIILKSSCIYYNTYLDHPFISLYNNSDYQYDNILFYCFEHMPNNEYNICEEKISFCMSPYNNESHIYYYHKIIYNVYKKNTILQQSEVSPKESLICFNQIDYTHIITNYYQCICLYMDNTKKYCYNYPNFIQPKYVSDSLLQEYLFQLQKGKMFTIHKNKDNLYNYEIQYIGYYIENNKIIYFKLELLKNNEMIHKDWYFTEFFIYIYTEFSLFKNNIIIK